MNDRWLVDRARVREPRAREREARALAHERVATQRVQEATTPESAEHLRREAEAHRIAPGRHHRAIEIQAQHAKHHESQHQRPD